MRKIRQSWRADVLVRPLPTERRRITGGTRTSALLFLLLTACTTAAPSNPELKPAPWSGARLHASDVPPVLLTEWKKAENRTTCAPLGFRSLGEHTDATPRRASFSGGWAVAYDKPGLPGKDSSGYPCATCGRSAFGIAGAGVVADDADVTRWPKQQRWSDGSGAGWGLEGDTGPGWLAYVHVAGQDCLYNVWSRLGVAHLEFLLSQLRFVE